MSAIGGKADIAPIAKTGETLSKIRNEIQWDRAIELDNVTT